LIERGDWIYHINYSYAKVEHSGIFVDWVDRERKLALMLSYAGERRKTPARYKVYDPDFRDKKVQKVKSLNEGL